MDADTIASLVVWVALVLSPSVGIIILLLRHFYRQPLRLQILTISLAVSVGSITLTSGPFQRFGLILLIALFCYRGLVLFGLLPDALGNSISIARRSTLYRRPPRFVGKVNKRRVVLMPSEGLDSKSATHSAPLDECGSERNRDGGHDDFQVEVSDRSASSDLAPEYGHVDTLSSCRSSRSKRARRTDQLPASNRIVQRRLDHPVSSEDSMRQNKSTGRESAKFTTEPAAPRTLDEILITLNHVEDGLSRGYTIRTLCLECGISPSTLLRWRKKYGGLTLDQIRFVKKLEEENRQQREQIHHLNFQIEKAQAELERSEVENAEYRRSLQSVSRNVA